MPHEVKDIPGSGKGAKKRIELCYIPKWLSNKVSRPTQMLDVIRIWLFFGLDSAAASARINSQNRVFLQARVYF